MKNSIDMNSSDGKFVLPELPYDKDFLEPHISKETLELHYGKHHQAYVTKLNDLIKNDEELKKMTLVEIIAKTQGDHAQPNQSVFNNAAQVWNHTFYWYSMKKGGGGDPDNKNSEIGKMIDRDFSEKDKKGIDRFREMFTENGMGQFGSGWVWLVYDEGKLKILKTSNAELPGINDSAKPLITMDVWEHAYYVDRKNERNSYVKIFLDHLLNWDFAEENLIRVMEK